ncbi:hypothetical protein TNCV_4280441 [Trichonephila clavipes]|nr:hypothetical protein TNCV_4280441 [Trichonephila clavipes]
MSVQNSSKPAIVRLDNVVPRRSLFTTNYYGSDFICLLYRFETPCKSPAEDADHETVLVFHLLVEMPDCESSTDAELRTALVSRQLCELLHAPPVQAFTDWLIETFH